MCDICDMTNGIAFSDRQVEQLTELLYSQRESIVDELKAYVDGKFEQQEKRIDDKFVEQDKRIDTKFAAQDKRIDAKFKKRLMVVEPAVAKLQST